MKTEIKFRDNLSVPEEEEILIKRCFILLCFIQMLNEKVGIRKTDTRCPIYKIHLLNEQKPVTWNL